MNEPPLEEMIRRLKNRTTHSLDSNPYSAQRFAWNIKVYQFDESGKHQDFPYDTRRDVEWQTYLASHGSECFARACSAGLSIFFENEFNYFEGFALGHPLHKAIQSHEFYQSGRSGGWLVLNRLNGWEIDPAADWAVVAEEEPDFLRMVYHACEEVDRFDPRAEIEYQYAFIRSEWEDERRQQEKRNRQEKEDCQLVGTFMYLCCRYPNIIEAAQRLGVPTRPDGTING